nr:hypothetical protein GCM10020093_061400 [Planobispora longispora]
MLVLPMSGSCAIECDGVRLTLDGRVSVFDEVTDFAYLPVGATARITGEGRFAFPSARATRRLPVRYGPADRVPVEVRGAGQATRQVNNFCAPDAFDCDKLVAVEVLTPAATGRPTRRTSTTRLRSTRPSWRRSTTSRAAPATSGCTARTTPWPR